MTTIQTNTVDQGLLDTVNGKKKTETSTTAAAEDRFLKLLITQIQNQDPLNPLDNAQVTSQLAQLSTVTGIEKLNASVESLLAQVQASQNLQSANLIGHGVIVPGSSIALANGNAIYGVDLPQSVDRLQVTIKDSNGLVVRNIDLGVAPAGVSTFTWDGKSDAGVLAQNGVYQFTVDATAGAKKITASTLSFGLVDSISSGAQGNKLTVANVGDVNVSDIKQVY